MKKTRGFAIILVAILMAFVFVGLLIGNAGTSVSDTLSDVGASPETAANIATIFTIIVIVVIAIILVLLWQVFYRKVTS